MDYAVRSSTGRNVRWICREATEDRRAFSAMAYFIPRISADTCDPIHGGARLKTTACSNCSASCHPRSRSRCAQIAKEDGATQSSNRPRRCLMPLTPSVTAGRGRHPYTRERGSRRGGVLSSRAWGDCRRSVSPCPLSPAKRATPAQWCDLPVESNRHQIRIRGASNRAQPGRQGQPERDTCAEEVGRGVTAVRVRRLQQEREGG